MPAAERRFKAGEGGARNSVSASRPRKRSSKAAALAVRIQHLVPGTLTRLPPDCDPEVGPLSRNAGEGLQEVQPQSPLL